MGEVKFCQNYCKKLEEYSSKSNNVFLNRSVRMIFKEYPTNKTDEARLDISVHGL